MWTAQRTIFLLSALLFTVSPGLTQPFGLGIVNDGLVIVDLSQGTAREQSRLTALSSEDGPLAAVTVVSSRSAWVIAAGNPGVLFNLDPQSDAILSRISLSAPLNDPRGVAANAAGQVWITDGGILYNVNLETGGLTPILTVDPSWTGLTHHNGSLWGYFGPNLIEIDTAGNTLRMETLAMETGPFGGRTPLSLDFDVSGQLWISIYHTFEFPSAYTAFSRFDIDDLKQDVLSESIFPTQFTAVPLAILPLPAPQDVPTLSQAALIALATILAALSVHLLRRRSRQSL